MEDNTQISINTFQPIMINPKISSLDKAKLRIEIMKLQLEKGKIFSEGKKISLEEKKFSLEDRKLSLEEKKFLFEKDKLLVAALIEDFKARWQELLNFESENSRWETLYVTALMLVISWVLSNSGSGANVKYKNIEEIFKGDNSYLLLTLALINAFYTLAMAYKGYQIQEIAQYLFKNIGSHISNEIRIEFNSWERWRRDETGTPKFIRTFYYAIIGILPTAVSAAILILFCYYRYKTEYDLGLIIFFIFVCIFVTTSFLAALYTTKMNNKWNEILSSKKVSLSEA